LLATLCLALGASSFAADNAYLYIVQGIPGYDVSKNLNPGYPVDVLIDGDCLARGLTFGNTDGPISLPPEPMMCRSAKPIRLRPAPTQR
jgi:hypothetical protein